MAGVFEGQRTFSVEEYHCMGEAGVFGPEERVELSEGVIRQMSPKGKRLVRAFTLASHLLEVTHSGEMPFSHRLPRPGSPGKRSLQRD